MPVYSSKLTTEEYVSVEVANRAFNISELGQLPSVVSNVQAVTKQAASLQPGEQMSCLTATVTPQRS